MAAGIGQSVYRLGTVWTVRGSNLGWGEIFSDHPDRPRNPPSPVQWVLGVKWQGRFAYCPPTSSAEVANWSELNLRLPSVPA